MQITIGGCEGNVEPFDPNGHQQGSQEDNENVGSTKPIDSFEIMTLDKMSPSNPSCNPLRVLSALARAGTTTPMASVISPKVAIDEWLRSAKPES